MKRENEKMFVSLLNTYAENKDMTDEQKIKAINEIHEEMRELKCVERLEGEIFKLVPTTTRFYASNLGRILKITSEGESLCRLLKSVNKTGRYYYDVSIEANGEKFKCRASRVIAKTWLNSELSLKYNRDDKLIVDHISEDTLDNSISNIRVFTYSENIKRAIYEFNKDVGKVCRRCFAKNDTEYREYVSTAELVKDIIGSDNKGYFNHAVKYSHKLKGWDVGYID